MNVIPTDLNRKLAGALRYSVAAEALRVAGQSGFWRLIGIGLLVFGMGVAFGASFYGYALVMRNSENLTTLSSIFAKAFSEVQLHGVAQGTVELDRKELPLSPGGIIGLSSDSRLILDPKAKVSADGELKIQVPPAMSSFASPTVPPNRRTPAQPIVNFTIFKTMVFDKGSVMTGWKF